MQSPKGASELASLQTHWEQWTAIIERFARRRRTRHWVDAEAYAQLHREVLRACWALAGHAGEAKRAFFEGLADLAKPWLSPHVLERTDWEILIDLLVRCRQAADELTGRRSSAGSWRWAGRALLIAGVVLGLVLVGWLADRFGVEFPGWLRARGQASWVAIEVRYLAIASIIGIPLAIYWVWHSVRG